MVTQVERKLSSRKLPKYHPKTKLPEADSINDAQECLYKQLVQKPKRKALSYSKDLNLAVAQNLQKVSTQF